MLQVTRSRFHGPRKTTSNVVCPWDQGTLQPQPIDETLTPCRNWNPSSQNFDTKLPAESQDIFGKQLHPRTHAHDNLEAASDETITIRVIATCVPANSFITKTHLSDHDLTDNGSRSILIQDMPGNAISNFGSSIDNNVQPLIPSTNLPSML